tara:strand:- start:10 stop:831 length:822 start_codon:yes stop_codon:yes gene_type:complete
VKKISFFCLTLNPSHEKIIKKLSFIPVGLGDKKFSEECLGDKTKKNISFKNPFYGEYTFHYWLWNNYLDKIETEWVGFCQYRKFFMKKDLSITDLNYEDLTKNLIKEEDLSIKDFDCILGSQFTVENFKISKIFKNHLYEFLSKPSLLFSKKKRNLKFHFDLFHGKGNLDLAINLLDEDNKKDFRIFMNSKTSFNPHNMFICKTKILKKYYETIFPWLENCEKIFGFNDLQGYGLKRIYGFLAERFLSYWFSKNYRVKEFPIIVKDLSDYKNL